MTNPDAIVLAAAIGGGVQLLGYVKEIILERMKRKKRVPKRGRQQRRLPRT